MYFIHLCGLPPYNPYAWSSHEKNRSQVPRGTSYDTPDQHFSKLSRSSNSRKVCERKTVSLFTTLLKTNYVGFPCQEILWTPAGCSTIDLHSAANHREFMQHPRVKGSVPQNCPHCRCQLQVVGLQASTLLSDLATNRSFPPSSGLIICYNRSQNSWKYMYWWYYKGSCKGYRGTANWRGA